MMIEQLSNSLLGHEAESMQMASKLSQLKTEMMENEIGYGAEKKYGAIKMTKLRNTPCTVSKLKHNFFVDSICQQS